MAKVWVSGYTKSDGTKVEGYYREYTSRQSRKAKVYAVGYSKIQDQAMKRASKTGNPLRALAVGTARLSKFKQTGRIGRKLGGQKRGFFYPANY